MSVTALEATQRVARTMSETDLRTLNRYVVDLINDHARARAQEAARRFYPGDLVEFTNSRTGEAIRIRVERINTKSVTGKEIVTPFRQWRVAPTMLRLVGGS